MRFLLNLTSILPTQRITFNYQYPLSAAIYKIIYRADEAYATFLHEQGYKHGNKSFKFFTFSDLQTPFIRQGNKMVMTTRDVLLTICFQVPDAAENFIKGLFMNQQLDIADNKDKASFIVQQVTAVTTPVFPFNKAVLLQPMSPVVVGRNNERGNYDYVSPDEPDFSALLLNNLISKYAALHQSDAYALNELSKSVLLQPVFFTQPPRSRLVTIKNGTAAETQVRGFDKFRLRIQAPESLLTLALNAGVGMHNAMGMGCLELLK